MDGETGRTDDGERTGDRDGSRPSAAGGKKEVEDVATGEPRGSNGKITPGGQGGR